MEIVIDREKRITLLRWLKRGVIDSEELDKINGLKDLTTEEMESELDRLTKCYHKEQCERIRRLGYCKADARTLTMQEAKELWQQLENEY